jgi:hypothetical protein
MLPHQEKIAAVVRVVRRRALNDPGPSSDNTVTGHLDLLRDRVQAGQIALEALSRYSVVFALAIALILVVARP